MGFDNAVIIDDDENYYFDIFDILSSFFRNKKLVGATTFIIFILSILLALSKERIWGGGFKIVIEQNESSPSFASISSARNLRSLFNRNANQSLLTKVEILKSSSVLMPVFEVWKDNQISKGNSSEKLTYDKWQKSHLKIEIVDDTSILEVTYMSPDRNQILPIVTLIKNQYDDYTKNLTKKTLSNEEDFLKNQVKIFKEKSLKSAKILDEFAFNNNFTLGLSSSNVPKVPLTSEEISINSAFKNKLYAEELLKALNTLNKEESVNLILSNRKDIELIPENIKDSYYDLLQKLEFTKKIYTEEDRNIQKLRGIISDLESYIITKTKEKLGSEIVINEAIIQSSQKPKEKILKFKTLFRESMRANEALNNLESQLLITSLQVKKDSDTWNLITNPMLYQEPLSPRRKRIALGGALIGLLLGGFLSIIKDKRTDIVFSKNEIIAKIKAPEILDFDQLDNKSINSLLKIFINSKLLLESKYYFLISKNVNSESLSFFKKQVNYFAKSKAFEFIEDLKDYDSKSTIYLVTQKGIIKNKDIKIMKKSLNLENNNFEGIIFLDKTKI